ncbi:MAG: hypothetical protein MUF23_05250 [Pirellula sp.]|nr:hypothetical protein [Pirellula sp.]
MTRRTCSSGWWKLIAASAVLMVIWMILLPWLGQLSPVRDHIRHMQEKGIRPDAMYYTELE